MASPIRFTDYDVSPKTGFLLEDALEYLPEYFEPWNRLAKNMPDLVAKQEMRKAVKEMPRLSERKLANYREKRLAHLQLVIITSGYVWEQGDEGVPKRLPKKIAVPLFNISQDLGIEPVICHPAVCLSNWRYTEEEGSPDQPPIRCLYMIPGGAEAEWFFKVTCFVELAFAGGMQTIQNILDGVHENDVEKVKTNLAALPDLISSMQNALMKMHDNLTAQTFYFEMRPFLGGWGGEDSPLPDGLIYEGIDEEPFKCNGGSAAQSTTLQVLDILLGVQHTAKKKEFLEEMRDYMPPDHRRLLEDMEKMPRTLTQMVSSAGDKDLQDLYNTCLDSIIQFRTYHIQVVTKFIIIPSSRTETPTNFESLSKKGTGGTDLLHFLKGLRDDTIMKKL